MNLRSACFFSLAGLLACGSTIDVGNGGSGPAATLNGTWDITAAGTDGAHGSQLTVSGGTVKGVLIQPTEGISLTSTCVLDQDRREFTFSASGNALSGTITEVRHTTGTGCPTYKDETMAFSGARTRSAPASTTDLNGDWQVSGNGESWGGTLDGAGGSAASMKRPNPWLGPATLNISVVGDSFTVSGSDPTISFAAHRR